MPYRNSLNYNRVMVLIAGLIALTIILATVLVAMDKEVPEFIPYTTVTLVGAFGGAFAVKAPDGN